MPSLISGFEYDVFISYRHNDNSSGWVTDFVKCLKEELASTIKEPLSVYFDENPHDGLLETHSVDKSLEGKLKCFIFVPVLSQTYCDTKSFAWQNEFLVFNALSVQDHFGRDIKLNNGNVASRILPIKIHALDAEDKGLIESEIGGALRAIEFIYKEVGVNRPLLIHEEDPSANQNHTFYRNQVNKVANGIKEIFAAANKHERSSPTVSRTAPKMPEVPRRLKRSYITIALAGLLSIIGYFLYGFLNQKKDAPVPLTRSIAVLPFVNMSNDVEQDYFSDGITEEITARLSMIEGMKVKSHTTVFKYKDQTKDAITIAEELGVNTILEGSVRKQGNKVVITAQLINGKTDEHIWSETYNRELKDIFEVQSDIAQQIARKFLIDVSGAIEKKLMTPPTQNSIAYDLYLKAQNLFSVRKGMGGKMTNQQKAIYLLKEAIDLDPDFADAYASLGETYTYIALSAKEPKRWLDSATILANKAITLSPDRDRGYMALADVMRWQGVDEELNQLFRANEIAPFSTTVAIIYYYLRRNLFEEAADWTRKAIAHDPREPDYLAAEGRLYYKLGLTDSLAACVARSRRFQAESDDTNVIALNHFTFIGDLKEYTRLSTKLFVLDEKEFAFNMGIYHMFQRNWKKADSCLARSTLPDEIDAGLVKIHLGQSETGKKFLNNVIENRKSFSAFDNYWHLYDISRAYAALQDRQYIQYLEMARKKGWHEYSFFQHDPFFDLVKGTDEFKKIEQEMAEQNQRYLKEFYRALEQ